MFIGVLHGGAAEATRPEVELVTDATLGAAVVDDLFGIRPVAPTSRIPNAYVGILDGQQCNVVIVAVIRPLPPRNVVEILLDEVAQPPEVGVLPPAVWGRRATADFLEQCHSFGVRRVATILQHRSEVLGTGVFSAAASPMRFRPLSGFRRLIGLSISSKHNASR
jgi:hypothetical protein